MVSIRLPGNAAMLAMACFRFLMIRMVSSGKSPGDIGTMSVIILILILHLILWKKLVIWMLLIVNGFIAR